MIKSIISPTQTSQHYYLQMGKAINKTQVSSNLKKCSHSMVYVNTTRHKIQTYVYETIQHTLKESIISFQEEKVLTSSTCIVSYLPLYWADSNSLLQAITDKNTVKTVIQDT